MNFLLYLSAFAVVAPGGRIKHVVVIYFENRAFDHLLGWQKSLKSEGLHGSETNPISLKDPTKGNVTVYPGATYVADLQPQHGYDPYQTKFDITSSIPRMDGFLSEEMIATNNNLTKARQVMGGFADGALPVTTTLAKEFAVFDHWYAAFPGPSWPNHMMTISGTANGDTNTGDGYRCKQGTPFPQPTIFDHLLEAGHEYARIYNDTAIELYIESFTKNASKARTQNMDRFFHDAAHGTLPALTWIAPRQGVNRTLGPLGGPNSDHPNCCDVALGERLRKDVYEALRAGPAWNETAFLFTWDDPGGFFDHALPPMRAPPPDDQPPCFCAKPGSGDEVCGGHAHGASGDPRGYNPYTRLGSRLPVVLVSPWVKKGTVVGEPSEGQRPAPDSKYDGTSIAATIKRLFGLPKFLSRRDAWSASFDHLFDELNAPRTDTPAHLPEAPPPSADMRTKHPWGTDCDDPTRRMRRTIRDFEALLGKPAPARLHACAASNVWTTRCGEGTMDEATEWLAGATEQWRRGDE
jgi:phospholipase C